MKKLVKVIYILIITIFLTSNIVLANLEETEETLEILELNQEIVSASADLEKEPSINSRCAVVLDRNSKIALYNKNMDTKRPMASTTKIMTS